MFKIEKPHPQIFIFKNAIKNPEEILEHFSSPFYSWEPWYTFGSQLNLSNLYFDFNSFPTKEEWEEKLRLVGKNEIADFLNQFIKKNIQNQGRIGLTEKDLLFLQKSEKNIKKITDLFYKTTSLYIKETGIEKNNLIFNPFNIAKYDDDAGISENFAMNYHTDFIQHESSIVENNFYVTCLFYLNDGYVGGEISFKVLDKNQKSVEFSYDYKPSSGDMIVFPSTPPFYHGVKKARQGEKYIIRTYWKNIQKENKNFKNQENDFFSVDGYIFQGFQDII